MASGNGRGFQPATFLFGPVDVPSKHSREQYSDILDPPPIARSAGIHVSQATHRTSLFSVLVDPLRGIEVDGELASKVLLTTRDTLRNTSMYGRRRE